MNIVKQQILDEFLITVSIISNIEYQKRVWVRGEGPEVDDFDETVCDFFDLGEPIFNDHVSFEITESQYQLLEKFRDAFDKFSDRYYYAIEFIDTPEWAKIMKMAKEVLDAFNYKKTKES